MSGKAKTKLRLPQQIAIRLRDKIAKEKLVPGDKLPTEPDLIKEMGVSRTVLREAIATLKAEGLVEAKQGVGVFVSSPKTETMASLAQGEMRVTVLDVGQGLSVVIKTATHLMVYDTGRQYSQENDAGNQIVLP